MTGKEWDTYFSTLNYRKQRQLLKVLMVLAEDSAFKKAFGNSFRELAYILAQPLDQASPRRPEFTGYINYRNAITERRQAEKQA